MKGKICLIQFKKNWKNGFEPPINNRRRDIIICIGKFINMQAQWLMQGIKVDSSIQTKRIEEICSNRKVQL